MCDEPRVAGKTLCEEHLAEFMAKPLSERLGTVGIATIVISTIILIALGIAAVTWDDPSLDDFGGSGGYSHPDTVYVAVYNTHAPGYVSVYADGVLVHTMYLEKGESDGYHYEVSRTIRWTAAHEDGFTDFDDAGPGSDVFLTV